MNTVKETSTATPDQMLDHLSGKATLKLIVTMIASHEDHAIVIKWPQFDITATVVTVGMNGLVVKAVYPQHTTWALITFADWDQANDANFAKTVVWWRTSGQRILRVPLQVVHNVHIDPFWLKVANTPRPVFWD